VHIERGGQTLAHHLVGRLRGEGEAPMREDAIFRIASMTKPIVSVATLILMEQGRLRLEQTVAEILPELATLRAAGAPVPLAPTVLDLLRHTAGFGYLGEYHDAAARAQAQARDLDGRLPSLTPQALLGELAAQPLAVVPRSRFCYGFSTDVLGLVLERVTGMRLREVLRTLVLDPLGMHDTDFIVPEDKQERFATAYAGDTLWAGFIDKYGGARSQGMPMQSGGGGLASTMDNYLRFARVLAGGGESGGVRLLRPETVALMTRDHLEPHMTGPDGLVGPGFGFGLGVAVRRNYGASAFASVPGEVTWSGICGPVFYVHPTEGWIAVSMAANMATRMLSRMEFRHAAQTVLAAA
jgi:CubicO group peptidase (beta-lactamase class C family)